jgi:Mn-dependent DtxR family transcriptional regulator
MENNSMLEKLRSIIITRQTLNENKCGTTVMFLIEELNLGGDEVKELLNELHAEKFIRVIKGINGKLIFLKR